MVDTILIDGNDVRTLPKARVVLIDGIYAPGERRGNHDPIPGVDGELLAALPLAKYIITIKLWLVGSTPGEWSVHQRALGPLIGGFNTNGLVALERHVDNDVGGFDSHSAPGAFITGLSPESLNWQTGRMTLQYYQGNGYWLDGTTALL